MNQGFMRGSKVKDQQSWISFLQLIQQFQVALRSTSTDMTTALHAWPYGRFIEIQCNIRRKKLHRTNQFSNFLGGSFSNRDNLRVPIQFGKERQPQHLRRWVFLINRPIHFHISSTSVFRPVKLNKLSFLGIEINKRLSAPVHSVS